MVSGRDLRFAVVGCGSRGRASIGFLAAAEGTRPVVVVDTDEEAARTSGERYGARWTTSLEQALGADTDAVLVSSPNHVHAEQAQAAIDAGKHVVIEKPLATTVEDALDLVRASRKAGVWTSPWLGYRYAPHIVAAKELVLQGAIGRSLGAALLYQRYRSQQYYKLGPWSAASGWHTRWETAGGGVLINNGIHYVDSLRYLLDSRIVEVGASYATLDSDQEVEDTIVGWMRAESGALMSLNICSVVQGLKGELVDCRLWGEDGHLSLTPPHQYFTSRASASRRPERWHDLDPPRDFKDPNIEFFERFARSVRDDRPPEIDVVDGLTLQIIIDGLYRAANDRIVVSLDYPNVE